jgi:hypothetical protein
MTFLNLNQIQCEACGCALYDVVPVSISNLVHIRPNNIWGPARDYLNAVRPNPVSFVGHVSHRFVLSESFYFVAYFFQVATYEGIYSGNPLGPRQMRCWRHRSSEPFRSWVNSIAISWSFFG